MFLTDDGTPILGHGAGITNTGPPLPEAPIGLQHHTALGFLNTDGDDRLRTRHQGRWTMDLNTRVQVLGLTLDSKPSIALAHVADGETEVQRG